MCIRDRRSPENAMAVQISFPDGNVKSFDAPPTGLEIAQGISPGLAKRCVVARVNGELWDLTRPIEQDASIELVTQSDPEALEVYRHDAAHVLAQAVQQLYPGTQITFGPATENGFHYDFVRDEPFTDEDLKAIEKRICLLYTSPSPRDRQKSRMPSSA